MICVRTSFLEILEQCSITANVAGIQKRCLHRHIGARHLNAILDGANRIAHIKTHVPEKIEDFLGNILNASAVLAVMEEHDIDVRVRVQLPPPISSGGHERYLFPAPALIAHIADYALKQLLHEDIDHLGNGAHHPDTIGTIVVAGVDDLTIMVQEMPGTGKIEGSFFLEGSPSGVAVRLVLVRKIPIDFEIHGPCPQFVFLPQAGCNEIPDGRKTYNSRLQSVVCQCNSLI